MHTLATAHENALENVIDQLLQDFLQVWGPDDYSTQFVDECLPLIFNIFRYSKVKRLLFLSKMCVAICCNLVAMFCNRVDTCVIFTLARNMTRCTYFKKHRMKERLYCWPTYSLHATAGNL